MSRRDNHRIVGPFRICRVANDGELGVFVERLSGMCFVIVLEDASQEMAEEFYRTVDTDTLKRHEANLGPGHNCITLCFDPTGKTFDPKGNPS